MTNRCTEEDTFRALKRVPFEQMRRIIYFRRWPSISDLEDILRPNGWTTEEYDEEWRWHWSSGTLENLS